MSNSKSLIVLLLQLVQSIFVAVTIIFIARLLGTFEYGRYVYYLTASSVLPLFVGLGGEHVFIMEASRERRIIPYLFGNAFYTRTLITILASLLCYLWMLIFKTPDSEIILLIIIGSLLSVFANPLFLSLYRVKGVHVRPWIISFIGPIFFIFYLFAIGKSNTNLFLVSLGFFLSNLLTLIVFLVDTMRFVRIKYSIKYFKLHFKNGVIFSVSQAFDFAFSRLDIFLLQLFVGSNAVGIYAAGQRVVSIFQLIPSSFHVVELPEFHRVSNDKVLLLKKFLNLRRLMFELSLIVFGLLILNAQVIIDLLFGSDYTESVSIVYLLCISGIFLFVNYPYYMLAEAINKIRQRMIIRIITFLFTLIFVAAIIKLEGMRGAAYGLIGGQLLFMMLLHRLTNEVNGGWKFFFSDLKILMLFLLAACITMGINYFLEDSMIRLFIGSSFFLIFILVIGQLFNCLHFLKMLVSILPIGINQTKSK